MENARRVSISTACLMYRNLKGLTSLEAARKFGCAPSTWRLWERGVSNPQGYYRKRLLGILTRALDREIIGGPTRSPARGVATPGVQVPGTGGQD